LPSGFDAAARKPPRSLPESDDASVEETADVPNECPTAAAVEELVILCCPAPVLESSNNNTSNTKNSEIFDLDASEATKVHEDNDCAARVADEQSVPEHTQSTSRLTRSARTSWCKSSDQSVMRSDLIFAAKHGDIQRRLSLTKQESHDETKVVTAALAQRHRSIAGPQGPIRRPQTRIVSAAAGEMKVSMNGICQQSPIACGSSRSLAATAPAGRLETDGESAELVQPLVTEPVAAQAAVEATIMDLSRIDCGVAAQANCSASSSSPRATTAPQRFPPSTERAKEIANVALQLGFRPVNLQLGGAEHLSKWRPDSPQTPGGWPQLPSSGDARNATLSPLGWRPSVASLVETARAESADWPKQYLASSVSVERLVLLRLVNRPATREQHQRSRSPPKARSGDSCNDLEATTDMTHMLRETGQTRTTPRSMAKPPILRVPPRRVSQCKSLSARSSQQSNEPAAPRLSARSSHQSNELAAPRPLPKPTPVGSVGRASLSALPSDRRKPQAVERSLSGSHRLSDPSTFMRQARHRLTCKSPP